MHTLIGTLVIAGGLLLSACGARSVTPVPMAQPGDERLSCSEIDHQFAANQKAAEELFRQDADVKESNVVKGVVLGAAGAALMDLSNSEQVEARSIVDRNEMLTILARSKGCGGA